jgi:hypothetical protein
MGGRKPSFRTRKNVADALAQPVDLSNEAVEARLMQLGSARLDPMFSERRGVRRHQRRQQRRAASAAVSLLRSGGGASPAGDCRLERQGGA